MKMQLKSLAEAAKVPCRCLSAVSNLLPRSCPRWSLRLTLVCCRTGAAVDSSQGALADARGRGERWSAGGDAHAAGAGAPVCAAVPARTTAHRPGLLAGAPEVAAHLHPQLINLRTPVSSCLHRLVGRPGYASLQVCSEMSLTVRKVSLVGE